MVSVNFSKIIMSSSLISLSVCTYNYAFMTWEKNYKYQAAENVRICRPINAYVNHMFI